MAFAGFKKDDHEKLTRAVTTHRTLTGEDLSSLLSQIPVAADETDPEAAGREAQAQLERQASVDRELELARQRQRQLTVENDHLKSGKNADGTDKGSVENQGPGMGATRTEAAKEQGAPPADAPNNPKARR